jgi:lysophospholipase L1-like esterase
MGDSIASGIQNMLRHTCVREAEIGITTHAYTVKYLGMPLVRDVPYRTAVISLGSNDAGAPNLIQDLRRIRQTVIAERVVWILPSESRRPNSRTQVKQIAAEYNDDTISIPDNKLGPDGIHPTVAGYDWLAEKVR